EKVGLLGKNGSGKTTMFKVITGEEPYESGKLSKASGKRIEMLAQIPIFGENDTSEDILRSSFAEIAEVHNAMKKIEGDANPAVLARYGRLMEEYERLGGYETEVRIDKVCGGMDIDERLRNCLANQLSGGEKARVNLARILLRECDILLLDEPTNHLDLASLEWLEKFLQDFLGTVVVVSHDRVFLDRVVTRIIEIDDGKANFFSGSYSFYVEEKRRRYISQSEQYERQQKEIKRIEERAKWFVEQNRFTTKHHAILSRIDHMVKIEKPNAENKLTAGFDSGGHASKEIVSFDSVCKDYGKKVLFYDLCLKIRRNDRLALIGANGCGKTTLLKMIAGEETPDIGEIKLSPNIKLGYLPQIVTFENMEATLVETLRSETGLPEDRARGILAGFHFMAADISKKVSSLSGGEKSRLKLCLMMQKNINFLLLDEPTNHLDIASREWIEGALADFSGTMLFVSHDRYFINKFADKIWSIENGEIAEYEY
ncbi:MAG: ATP-binding cassette domain-containing protein, partial [Oscillospiraceae bacterium]|nr:ATP-binding cassette domain-containing protein [Oscillospiraceae bacterium]